MATKTTFKDNIVQYPNRYILTDLGGGNYEITASPGTVTQAGTPLSAANLNSMSDEVIFKLKDTSTSTTTYTADLSGIANYYEGLTILFKPANTNTDASTININSVGAASIKKTDSSGTIIDVAQNDLIKNKYYTMTYDGAEFLMNNPSADLAEVISNIQDLENRLNTDEASINTLKNQAVRFAVSTGSNNIYGVSLSDVTTYYSGMVINLVPNFTNTGACTLQVNSLTAKAIKFNGSDLVSGDLVANKLYTLVYTGVQFELQVDSNKVASHLAENATESTAGHIQLATAAEVTTGTEATKAVTSKNLKNELDKKIDWNNYIRGGGYAVTSGTSTAYTITLNPAPTAYIDGQQFVINPHVACGATPTLNINGLGALPIIKSDGVSTPSAGEIKANVPLSLVRIGSNFFIRSSSGSNIKSYQNGTVTCPSGNTSVNVPIANVNTSNAIIKVHYPSGGNSNQGIFTFYATFIDSNTIQLTRINSGSVSNVMWEVVEYNNVKSKQTGIAALYGNQTGASVTISSVNQSKAEVYLNIASAGNEANSNLVPYQDIYLTSNTTLKLVCDGSANTNYYGWQVIEF